MDVLNRIYTQLVEAYRAMGRGSRLMAGVLIAVIGVGIVYLLLSDSFVPKVDLMHGTPISVVQLPLMEAAFAKANLRDYEIRGTSIFVPRGQEPSYMAALVEAKALPLNFGDALRKAINDGTPFDDRALRDRRIKIAMQDELALTIRSMNGIESAYVMYDVDTRAGLNKDKIVTASVIVKPAGNTQLDETRVASIRYFLAGAIAGLKPENVTISDLNGRTWVWNDPESTANTESHRLATIKRSYEQELRAKIISALSFIPEVTVAVNVICDSACQKSVSSAETDSKIKSGTTVLNSTAQYPNTATVLKDARDVISTEAARNTSATVDATRQSSAVSKTREEMPLALSARVSVGIPLSYFRNIWQERSSTSPKSSIFSQNSQKFEQFIAEESEKIRRHVAQLLPQVRDNQKPDELVTVTMFRDVNSSEKTTPESSEAFWPLLQNYWLPGSIVVGTFVALLCLRMIFGDKKNRADLDKELHIPERIHLSTKEELGVPPPHTRRFHDPNETIREELIEMVEEDPDAAANILRNWIGQVG